ncbi:MAG: 4Fe-4S dicluster domain-containing protein [Bdellovibrio sp.]
MTKSETELSHLWTVLKKDQQENSAFQTFSQWQKIADTMDRRDFMRLMGAAIVMASSACTRNRLPLRETVPYSKVPIPYEPSTPIYYATAVLNNGYAEGVLAKNYLGRPVKLEGNAAHPSSLGGTNASTQAAIYDLYDPDRSKSLLYKNEPDSWNNLQQQIANILKNKKALQGQGLALLTRTVTSPTLFSQIKDLRRKFPKLNWYQYQPHNRDNIKQASLNCFGKIIEPYYQLQNCDLVLSFDADFLNSDPGNLAYARQFIDRRNFEQGTSICRLYSWESSPSLTGAMADHRFPSSSVHIENTVLWLAKKFNIVDPKSQIFLPAENLKRLEQIYSELLTLKGRTLMVAGPQQPAWVHELIFRMNDKLDNISHTVFFTETVEPESVLQVNSCKALTKDIEDREVDTLFILNGNPCFDAPYDLRFTEALKKVSLSFHLSLYVNETSAHCTWHIPSTHIFETWSDARAYDGQATILQPLIEPLYNGRSAHQLLALLQELEKQDPYEIVKSYWKEQLNAQDFDSQWELILNTGVIANTKSSIESRPFKRFNSGIGFNFRFNSDVVLTANYAGISPSSSRTDVSLSTSTPTRTPLVSDPEIEVLFLPDPTIGDGENINNAWLQELPKPMTGITWDNPALVSLELAKKFNLQNGDLINITSNENAVTVAVWILSGQAANTITLHYGYGRTKTGKVGVLSGFDVFPIRNSSAMSYLRNVDVKKIGNTYKLASTQEHQKMEGEGHVKILTSKQLSNAGELTAPAPINSAISSTLKEDPDYAWGMVIDLNKCIGCGVCTIACQVENNIPVVGKMQVLNGRAMHWIRVDRYYEGNDLQPQICFQPIPCMHCEKAPCELVCPVGATLHSEDGLNQMVYNRCVGTRYCSNNCPYKVRRFNFYRYSSSEDNFLKMAQNPEVSVRSRGVMEKCTYCVQRIMAKKIEAEKEDRLIRDGEVIPACQQACPTRAIVFGNLKDKNSEVAKQKQSKRSYGVLSELGTAPRTTYLARITAPTTGITSAAKGENIFNEQ